MRTLLFEVTPVLAPTGLKIRVLDVEREVVEEYFVQMLDYRLSGASWVRDLVVSEMGFLYSGWRVEVESVGGLTVRVKLTRVVRPSG